MALEQRKKLYSLLDEIDSLWEEVYDEKKESYTEEEKIVLYCAALARQIKPLVGSGAQIIPHVLVGECSARIHFDGKYVEETANDINKMNKADKYRHIIGKWM
jgi:hypothetical protein